MERDDFFQPFITIGDGIIRIDGVKSVKKWDSEEIKLTIGGKVVILTGRGLKPEYKTLDSLMIKGRLSSIEFKGRER